MRVVVLPFNAASGASEALARQYAQFCSEIARRETDQEIDALSYHKQIQDQGMIRIEQVNPSEDLNEPETLTQFFTQQEGVANITDGLLTAKEDGGGCLTFRLFREANTAPVEVRESEFESGQSLSAIRAFLKALIEFTGTTYNTKLDDDIELFGTKNDPAFSSFLKGLDDLQYVERSHGRVAIEFSPQNAIDHLIKACELDKEWEMPLNILLRFCGACTMYRLGTGDMLMTGLNRALEVFPENPRVLFSMGELFSSVDDFASASGAYERALKIDPDEPLILSRLAGCQLRLGMPANAERNLKKAIQFEGDDKPSLDMLTAVLDQQNRSHEVPTLWKEQIDRQPQNPIARAKYAISLINTGSKEQGLKAFEEGMELLEDNTPLKRFYAPVLVNEQDFDRAMDFYEDFLDENPNDVQAMTEYAQTLQAAGREFEIPPVLKNILASNPDLNTRAQISAWLIELEQPKRAQGVAEANAKAEKGDHDSAVRELKPLKQWLSDYWKLWLVLANAQNALKQFADAEQSARRVLELFPACEPGYVALNEALAGQSKFDDAYALMQMAIQNMNQSLQIAISYGLAAKRAGHSDEAKQLAQSIRQAVGNQEELEPVLQELER